MTLVVAVAAGVLLGLALGALGGGGSILAVPALLYLLDQSPAQATTGSLVVVGVTSLIGAVSAYRERHVLLGNGIAFGAVALGGATLGAKASALVPEPVLLGSFAVLMLVVAGLMTARQVRRAPERVLVANGGREGGGKAGDGEPEEAAWEPGRHHFDEPIIRISPTFVCRCPQALKVLVTATAIGLLTGFLGVGGGFLVVPALVLALGLPVRHAAGTSLVVITMTSAAALVVRAQVGVAPDWGAVVLLTAASVGGALAGVRLARRVDTSRLATAFTVLVLGVALFTGFEALPALV